jgi:hypothetical protein
MDFPFSYSGKDLVVFINVDEQLDITLADIEGLVLDAISESTDELIDEAEFEFAERLAGRIDAKLGKVLCGPGTHQVQA